MPKPASYVQPIHFEDFNGSQFERLVFAYHVRIQDWKSLEWYGQAGSDLGRDIWGMSKGGEAVCIQCVNRERLTFAKIRDDLSKVLSAANGIPYRFRIVTRSDVSASMRDKIKSHVRSKGVAECDIWSGKEFEEFLRHRAESLLKRFISGTVFPDAESELATFAQSAQSPSGGIFRQGMELTPDEAIIEGSSMIASYKANIQGVIGAKLPPLEIDPKSSDRGQELIATLLQPPNRFLIGPSGTTKTFHLHHLAVAMTKGDTELPIFVDAKSYVGSFYSHLRRCAAPFFAGDFDQLLKASAICRIRPVLLVDALNECPFKYLDELLTGLQEFSLQYGARLVGTSKADPKLVGHLRSDLITMSLPREHEKHWIYSYHAGIPTNSDIKYLCAPFTNAYDLAIAGTCHSGQSSPSSRVDLYDRYVRRSLSNDASVISAFLRNIAGELSRSFSLVMRRSEFERKAEHFLTEQQVRLSTLDDLMQCRLLDVSEGFVSFEHELLFDYFRAEHLIRQFPRVSDLSKELQRPRNQNLFEFVLPRFFDAGDIEDLLLTTSSIDSLCRVIEGKCGSYPKLILERQCEDLLQAALQDLPRINAKCESVRLEDGRNRFVRAVVENNRAWSLRDRHLCAVIARSLDLPEVKRQFLLLLDATERHLKEAVHLAARASNFRPSAVWSESVRSYGGTLDYGTMTLPCTTILSEIRNYRMFSQRLAGPLPIHTELIDRAMSETVSHFALHALNRDWSTTAAITTLDLKLDLVQRGLESGIDVIKLDSIDLLHSMRREMDNASEDQMQRARGLLEGIETNNIMLNSLKLEVLASYGGLELVVTEEEALTEMRSVINADPTSENLTELASLQNMSVEQVLSQSAYSYLSRIFEDIFQGVYWEAYQSLDEGEKRKILCVAAKEAKASFSSDWILSELMKFEGEEVVEIYRQWASGIDAESFSPQEAVLSFMLAIKGWAKHESLPPEYRVPTTVDDLAWKTMGQLLYWHFRQADTHSESKRIQELWNRLSHETPDAVADVLYQLSHSQWRAREDSFEIRLETLYSDQVRPLFEHSVERRASLTSIFRHGGRQDPSVIRYILDTLGDIGNQNTISLLNGLVEDPSLGMVSIKAIAAIRSRLDKL
jgi:hypothetical protein